MRVAGPLLAALLLAAPALADDPAAWELAMQDAIVALNVDDLASAEAHFRDALSDAPGPLEEAESRHGLAFVLVSTGRNAEAVTVIDAALARLSETTEPELEKAADLLNLKADALVTLRRDSAANAAGLEALRRRRLAADF